MSVKVTVLGSGDAFNANARCHPAYLVTASGSCFLLDCGATTLMALKRHNLTGDHIDAVLISHLHGDHIAGIPFLLLECCYETPRQRPLAILGPPGTARRVDELYRVMYPDLAVRGLPFELRCVDVQPLEQTQLGAIDIFPFRVPHQQQEISLGMRVVVDGKTILYSGDTGWTEDLVTYSQGTDLFLCECCYFTTRVGYHLDYLRIAENHRRFGCRRLVLTHIGREVRARRSDVALEIADDDLVVEL